MSDQAALLDVVRVAFAAFNAHDLDRITSFFAEEQMPRGSDPRGRRFVGKKAVRESLHSRFIGIPDVHYGDDEHFVAGDVGVSKWPLRGTSLKGEPIEVRGCDFHKFRAGKVIEKDPYWKIRER